MKRFSRLFEALDRTTENLPKIAALAAYFRETPPRDAAWGLALLLGERPKRLVPAPRIREATAKAAGIADWLFEDSYAAVGDLAETVSLLVGRPEGTPPDVGLADWIESKVLPLGKVAAEDQVDALLALWKDLPPSALFLTTKFLTGSFRIGVATGLVVKGLGEALGVEPTRLREALAGGFKPDESRFRALSQPVAAEDRGGQLYPFALASPIAEAIADGKVTDAESIEAALGTPNDWCLEWKWDGIRCQAVKRDGIFLWSRGEDLVTDHFPEVTAALTFLPNSTVLDGEVLGWREDKVMPFAALQTRIGRKKLTEKIRTEVPVAFLAYDLLELEGEDLRDKPLRERRQKLEHLLTTRVGPSLGLSSRLSPTTWAEASEIQASARERSVEGLMVKRWDSPYRAGRKRGDWWKWKVSPLTMDAVLLYAQAGHGRRATLHTDWTFAVWKEEELVPIAKAYSGLNDAELVNYDRWIRAHTTEKFGPVRRVEPRLVFELAFEGIQPSSRHKAGLSVRFPRILRPRGDKRPEDADTVEYLLALLPPGVRP